MPQQVSPAEVEEKGERMHTGAKRFMYPKFVPGRFVLTAARNL